MQEFNSCCLIVDFKIINAIILVMSIKSAISGISTVNDVARACRQSRIKLVDIRVQENERWDNGRAKRTLDAVITIGEKNFTLVRDTYPHSLTPAQIDSSMMLGPQKDGVLCKTLMIAAALERQKGISVSLIDGKTIDVVERELGIVRPGKECC
jgi:hypothetical protein